jgi:PAS domain S-box-containing protein
MYKLRLQIFAVECHKVYIYRFNKEFTQTQADNNFQPADSDNLTLSLLQATLDAMKDGILAIDLENRITAYNQRFVEIWNLPDSILNTRNHYTALTYAANLTVDPQAFIDLINGQIGKHVEAESSDLVSFKDGRIIELHSLPQRLNGIPVGRVWSFRDITEMHRMKEELLEQKLLLDNLLKAIPDNVYFKDIDSRFLRVSDAMIRFFNLGSQEDIIGKSDFDFFLEDHAREAYNCEQGIIRTGIGVDNIEEKETWPDGKITWTATSKVPLVGPDGKISGTLGISHDISNRKKMELALEEENRTKDKFLSIIAHDLRNPIGSIMGMSELALNELDEPDRETLKKDLQIIHSCSRQTLNLLENLLQWARAQQGRMVFDPVNIDLAGIVKQEIEFHSDLAYQKNISVQSRIHSPFFMVVDPNMIRTVFRNLLNNALKFTKPGGSVSIDYEVQNTKNVFSVSDSGIGIPDKVIHQIFRIDSKYTSAGTYGEKGSGLGLILCREFIARHGGEIWVESVEGAGSTFRFSIPLATS